MKYLFICYRNEACQKAKKWLEANKIEYEYRHIAKQNPTAEELQEWIPKAVCHQKFLIPVERFIRKWD